MNAQKQNKFNRGLAGAIVSIMIGLAGATHFESVVAGILCGVIVLGLFLLDSRYGSGS